MEKYILLGIFSFIGLSYIISSIRGENLVIAVGKRRNGRVKFDLEDHFSKGVSRIIFFVLGVILISIGLYFFSLFRY